MSLPLTIREVDSAKMWNSFVAVVNPNTFLQSWEWGQVQASAGEGVRYLGFYGDGGDVVGVALVLIVKARRGWHYLCPHGPIVATPALMRPALTALVEYLKKMGRSDSVIGFRLAPLLLDEPDERDFLRSLGFRPAPIHVHAELTWVLDITGDEAALWQGLRKTTRQEAIRARESGIQVDILTQIADIDRFLPLYAATQRRHGFVPFSDALLRRQWEVFAGSGHAYLAIARQDGSDVAAALLIHFGTTVFYHHGASQQSPGSRGAAHLVQWAAILEAKRRGAARYNFWGIAPPDEPRHPFAGITVFKRGFGGYAIPYIHAHDLPLAAGYWKLWAVDIYRKWRRGF